MNASYIVDKHLEMYQGGLYTKVKIKGIKKVYDFCKEVLTGKDEDAIVSIYYNPNTCEISGKKDFGYSIPDAEELRKGNIYCGCMEQLTKQWTLRWKVQKATQFMEGIKMEY